MRPSEGPLAEWMFTIFSILAACFIGWTTVRIGWGYYQGTTRLSEQREQIEQRQEWSASEKQTVLEHVNQVAPNYLRCIMHQSAAIWDYEAQQWNCWDVAVSFYLQKKPSTHYHDLNKTLQEISPS